MTNQWKQTTIPLRVENAQAGRSPKHIKARHRIQHAFHNWYRVNRGRFPVELDFINRNHALKCGFAGIDRRITVALVRNDLSIMVWWQDEDRKRKLFNVPVRFEAAPERVANGYICRFWSPGTRLPLPTLEAVWEVSLFEPFLKWVNKCLAAATELHFHVKESGSSYATLTPEPTDIGWRTSELQRVSEPCA